MTDTQKDLEENKDVERDKKCDCADCDCKDCECEDKDCHCEDKECKDCEAKAKESEEWKNKYLRALADYNNLEKRTSEQVQELQKRTKKQLMHKFLEVLDTIDNAEIFIKDAGLTMVKNNFLKILKEENVKEMDLIGKEYDPQLAEAIEVVSTTDEKENNKVVEVVSKGYVLDDAVLKIARVKVGKIQD